MLYSGEKKKTQIRKIRNERGYITLDASKMKIITGTNEKLSLGLSFHEGVGDTAQVKLLLLLNPGVQYITYMRVYGFFPLQCYARASPVKTWTFTSALSSMGDLLR